MYIIDMYILVHVYYNYPTAVWSLTGRGHSSDSATDRGQHADDHLIDEHVWQIWQVFQGSTSVFHQKYVFPWGNLTCNHTMLLISWMIHFTCRIRAQIIQCIVPPTLNMRGKPPCTDSAEFNFAENQVVRRLTALQNACGAGNVLQ